MGLKDLYYSLEDKWYKFVDSVSEKVPVLGSLVDAVEEKGIPSLPLAILILLLLIFGIFLLLSSGQNASLGIIVKDAQGNAISGATVVLLAGGEEKAAQQTNSEGKTVFLTPLGEYSVRITKQGYTAEVKGVNLTANTVKEYTLTAEDVSITRAVYLKTADNSLATGSGTLLYKCAKTSEEKTATYANGSFLATVNKDCEEIQVISVQNYSIVSATASFSGNGAVVVEETEAEVGNAVVNLSIEGQSGAPKAGLTVKLVPTDGTSPVIGISEGTALVLFNNISAKNYYVLITDSSGTYETYDGSKTGQQKAVAKGATVEFSATLKLAQNAVIKVNVTDASNGMAVKGAEVRVASIENSNDFSTQVSGATGQVSFNVSVGKNYVVTADQPEYLIGETKPAVAGDTINMALVKVDETNSNSLLVKVVDAKKKPIDNARVVLKKIDAAEPVVAEKTTGSSGEVEFFNLELGKSYFAVVSKEGFGSINSASAQISPRSKREVEVVFDIGEGRILLTVLDSEKNPLAGVSVKAINYYNSLQEGSSQVTGSDGTTEFTIRADKKVYFVAETASFSKYVSATITPRPNTGTADEKTIIMQRSSSGVKAIILGIYSGEGELKSGSQTIGQGVYTVKALVQVPKGTFSEAGLHLRTGKETQNTTNLMEEDGLYIGGVESAGRVRKGTTYSPPNGYDKDSLNLTQGNAKWVDSTWKNATEGTYEVEAEIMVTETNPNAPLNLYYRAWAKGSSVLRDPTSTASGNELYASANRRILTAGAGSICGEVFCKAYTLQTITGSEAGKTRYITGTIEAKKEVQYLLTADLTNYSGRTISGALLTVEGQSLTIDAISVRGTEYKENTVNLGNLGIDAPLTIQVLFTPTNSGTSGIKLTINSSTKTEFDELITVNVKANKKLKLEMTPKVIIPFIENEMFFEVKDANTPLSGVIISVKSGKDVLGSVTTNGEGLALYALAEAETGDEITITAKKEGYDEFVIVKTVDLAVLTIVPPEISETIKIGETTGLSTMLLMQNNTAKNLKVVGTQINGELKNYIDVKIDSAINNAIIETGKDKNFSLTMKLTSSALRLIEPKDVTGMIVINTEVSGTTGSYLNEIPVAIRLSMPGYLDSAKCLKVAPSSVEFIVSDAEQSKTVTLTNACTAEGTKIALNNLEAKLSEASKFGIVSISGKGFVNATLSDKYVKVADYYEKDAEETITLRFVPNVSVASGKQTFTVSIIGKNILDDKSEEKVEAQVKTTVTMSNLSKCIEIEEPEGGLMLDVAPWNLGYGRMMQSDFSSRIGSYGGFRQAPYSMQYMGGMGMQGYGAMGYGAGYGGMGTTNHSNYQQNSFTIKNNCIADVEIDLDPDPRINVSEEEFTIGADSDQTITVEPGYMLGKYKIKVNAKLEGTEETKEKVDEVNVTVRRLGDIDKDCIKTNVTNLNFNSFIYRPEKYSIYNYCYDSGVYLSRSNVASIECSAPMPTGGSAMGMNNPSYFQYGMESYYGSTGYPLGGQYTTMNSYIQQNGCQSGNCSLVTGTRVRTRDVTQGANGSIERVDFEVMPSTQYIAQRKLFDQKRGTYGLFQNFGDIRQWMTETDARTNVYGNLNVSYTNQYGSAECMEFPITISDMWRLGESIDSAINWGDPTARPKECQYKDALDVVAYWAEQKGVESGAVPNEAYNGSVYMYIAEPPALKIGPSPSQQSQYYPGYNYYYYNARQMENETKKETPVKNCGLLDGIDLITSIPAEKTGGAKVTVEDISSGSYFTNTRGSNLGVRIDRSGMTADCVYLEMPIVGSVTRAITFEKQDLTWMLKVLFTRPGYTLTAKTVEEAKKVCVNVKEAGPDYCEAKLREEMAKAGITDKSSTAEKNKVIALTGEKYPECKPYLSEKMLNDILTGTAAAKEGACTTKPEEYGFDKIKTTQIKSLNKEDLVDCSKYFCNNEMIQAYFLNSFSEIREKIVGMNFPTTSNSNLKRLSALYKEAKGYDINICSDGNLSYYKVMEGGALVKETYKIESPSLAAKQNSVTTKAATAIADMVEILNGIKKEDLNKILLEVDDNTTFTANFTAMGLIRTQDAKWYLSLKSYTALLQTSEMTNTQSDCYKANADCTITNWCGKTNVELKNAAMQWIAGHSRLVKAIPDTKGISVAEIEKVYNANPNLKEIHNLAKFNTNLKVNNDVLLTQINSFAKPTIGIFASEPEKLKDLTLKFNLESAEVGQYEAELDFNYGILSNKEADITLGSKKEVTSAPKAKENPLLKSGYLYSLADDKTILVGATAGKLFELQNNAGIFYKRIPVKLSVELYGGEAGIKYGLSNNALVRPANLMKWFATDGTLKGNDTKSGDNYNMSVIASSVPQLMNGLYYYPKGGTLKIIKGEKGGTISAKTTAVITAQTQVTIPQRSQPDTALQISEIDQKIDNELTMDAVVAQVIAQNACVVGDVISWNEKKMLSN